MNKQTGTAPGKEDPGGAQGIGVCTCTPPVTCSAKIETRRGWIRCGASPEKTKPCVFLEPDATK